MSQIFMVGEKFAANVNGKIVKRSNRKVLERMLNKTVVDFVAPQESRFSINQRFEFIADMVGMLTKGDQASVIVTGPGGLGKSFNVTSALERFGMRDITTLEVGDIVPKNSFRVIKGYSTAKGLYRTLYENRNSVLVFDDCDSVLKDPVSVNLLKGALDSYSKRIISWRADIRDDDLPTTFEFKGRVIFISNLGSSQMDQAIISRSMAVDLSMTAIQKIERMRFLLEQEDFMPEYNKACKVDAMDLIAQVCDKVKDLSLRTLITVTKIRKSAGTNWKNLAEYTICG
jgi:hypothetical protein